MKYIILGDVHGDLKHCKKIADENPDKIIIQIGDLGVGFLNINKFKILPKNFRFFCGNHDCRSEARLLTDYYLGDFGKFGKIFFISGADSIDRAMRIPGVSWWYDEEITYRQGVEAVKQWEASNCEIMLSHDVPQSFAESFLQIYDKSLTRNILEAAFEARKPKLWITGHHHRDININFNGVEFKVLGINKTLEI